MEKRPNRRTQRNDESNMEGGQRMNKHFLDLFSGLGGASEAFLKDASNWNVLRIDNNPLLSEVPNTVIMDLNDFTPIPAHRLFPGRFHLLHAFGHLHLAQIFLEDLIRLNQKQREVQKV